MYIIYYYTCILQLDGIKHDKEPKHIADMGGPCLWDLCVLIDLTLVVDRRRFMCGCGSTFESLTVDVPRFDDDKIDKDTDD